MKMTEYCNALDMIGNDRKLLYREKCIAAYKKDKSCFNRCVNASTLYGADKLYWEMLGDGEYFERWREEFKGNINRYAHKVWKAIVAASKYLSSEVTASYASYMCTLVEHTTGSRRQRLQLMYERDKQQFVILLRSVGLYDECGDAVIKIVRDSTKKCSKEDTDMVNKVHDWFYKTCKIIAES